VWALGAHGASPKHTSALTRIRPREQSAGFDCSRPAAQAPYWFCVCPRFAPRIAVLLARARVLYRCGSSLTRNDTGIEKLRSTGTANYSRTLVIDASTRKGGQLADQLNHAGFSAEFAVSWDGARAALRASLYHSCVVVADLDQVEDLKRLRELRREAMGLWIIVLCDLRAEKSLLVARRQGVDAVLSARFSMLDLTSRLAAFALRSRPIF
jgi:hypothetical protein